MNAGPYETEGDARRAAHEAGGLNYTNEGLLISAVEQAGLTLGAYDRRIIEWLANWEPATCAVVAGLITRAHAGLVDRLRVELAERDRGGPGTAQPGGGWISGPSS